MVRRREWFIKHAPFCTSSETQGQLVGAGKSLNGREKNSGEEKPRTRIRASGHKVLTDQFQTVGVLLAPDWYQKIFFLPNHGAARLAVVSCFPTRKEHIRQLFAIFWQRVYSRRKIPFTATEKCRGDPQETCQKCAVPFAGIVILAYLKDREFLYPHWCRSINFFGVSEFRFLERNGFFPYTFTSLAVTGTFPIPSNLSSHRPGKNVRYYLLVSKVTSKN